MELMVCCNRTKSVNYVIPGVFNIVGFATEEDEAGAVYRQIQKLIDLKRHKDIEGEIDYSSITVLARNKYVFKPLENLLKSSGVPYYYKTGGTGLKFSSSCMQLFDCYFRVKLNPLDKLHLSKLQEALKVEDVFNEEVLNMHQRRYPIHILRLVNTLTVDNFNLELKKFRNIFEENLIVGLTEDDRTLVIHDINELLFNWKEYQKKNQKRSLLGFKNSISLGTIQAIKVDQGITFSTVHTMKGQESDIVFLIGMDEGTFPDYRASIKGGVELQQEKNNAYVAFTRARRFLYVSYPKSRIMPWGDVKNRSISNFLKSFLK
jgi:DNA helicase-2/ATP-dependent DNA helicase PcrA